MRTLQGLPAWFVRAYGHRLTEMVTINLEGDSIFWQLRMYIYVNGGVTQFFFTKGWRAFYKYCRLHKGDRLIFNLVGNSHFVLSVRHHRVWHNV